MYKNTLLVGVDDFICDNFLKFTDNNVLCLSDNLVYLENLKRKYNISVYPLTFYVNEIYNFINILNKNSFKIKEVIFNVSYMLDSKPIMQIDFDKFCLFFDVNFKFYFLLIKIFLSNIKFDFCFFTFLINKKNTDKNNFLYQETFLNNLLISLMKELNKELFNNKIFVNCISLESINLSYRKNIYPYRLCLTKNSDFYNAYQDVLKKKLRNKIIVF